MTEQLPLIETVGLKKNFGSLEVLRGIDEKIYRGQVVSVIGPSGGGKSTFLRCLNLLETPSAGKVFLDGAEMDPKSKDLSQYRKRIGMVFQQFNVFPHLTVLENITLAPCKVNGMPKDQAEKEAMELLEKVGLADKAGEYPRRLSGGQKQRLAIVRAMAMHPEVMLFDEPTSALDPDGLCQNHQRPGPLHRRRRGLRIRHGGGALRPSPKPQNPAVPVTGPVKEVSL